MGWNCQICGKRHIHDDPTTHIIVRNIAGEDREFCPGECEKKMYEQLGVKKEGN
jgi:hypothetical protein